MGQKAKVSPLIFAASILCFIFPFLSVSCGGQKVATFTGVQLAIGTTLEQPQTSGPTKNQKVDPDPLAALAGLCAVIGIGLSFAGTRAAIAAAISGGLGAISLLFMRLRLADQVLKQGQGMLQVNSETGFSLALLLLIAGAAWNAFLFWQRKGDPLRNPHPASPGPPHVFEHVNEPSPVGISGSAQQGPFTTENMNSNTQEVCPACGSTECVGEQFCGNTGQRIVPEATVPAAAPAAPSAASAEATNVGKIAVVTVLGLALTFIATGVVSVAGKLFHSTPDQRPPQMQPQMAGTLKEFPVDTSPLPFRPTSVVSQAFNKQDPSAPVRVPQNSLPPGIKAAALPQIANSITSAVYQVTPLDSPINVHVLDTSQMPQAGIEQIAKDIQAGAGPDAIVTGVRAESPTGGQYGGYRVRSKESDAYILAKTAAGIAVMIFAPKTESREAAARLAANLGNGLGLLNDPEMNKMVCALPATPPPGVVLDQMTVANLDGMSGQISEALNKVLGSEGQRWADQLKRVMPEKLTTSIYRGPGNERIEAMVGNYGGTASALVSWTMLKWALRSWPNSKVQVNGTEGISIGADGKRFVLYQRGPYISVVQGKAGPEDGRVVALASTLQN